MPSIEVAAKIAYESGVTVDYLPGSSDKMEMDKKLMKGMEDIDALPLKKKKKCIILSIWFSQIINQKSF